MLPQESVPLPVFFLDKACICCSTSLVQCLNGVLRLEIIVGIMAEMTAESPSTLSIVETIVTITVETTESSSLHNSLCNTTR